MNSLRKTGSGWGVVRGPRGGIYHFNALGNKISGPPPKSFEGAKQSISLPTDKIADKHAAKAKLGRESQDGRSLTVEGHGVVGYVKTIPAHLGGGYSAHNLLRGSDSKISTHRDVNEAKKAVIKHEIDNLIAKKKLYGKHDFNTSLTADIP